MLTLDVELEEVARALLLVLKANLNDAIDDIWNEMVAKDAAFFAAMGQSVPATPKQYPALYFLGHHPSILERPSADYPNVTVVSHQHRSAQDAGDQYEVVVNTAYVEACLLNEDEDVLNRQTYRYAKALHRVLMEFKDLDDSEIEPMTATPRVDVSNAAARRLDQFSADIVLVQACRLEYGFLTNGLW